MRFNRRTPVTFSHPDGPAAAVESMADHLSQVFGGERVEPEIIRTDQLEDVGLDPFDVDRIIRVIRKETPSRKAPGCDHITGAMLKPIAAPLAQVLSPFLRLCWNRSRLPAAWRTAQVVPIHKKDDPTVAGNYRPISLTSTFRKIVERCLLPTLLDQMPALDIAQGGFRAQRGALDQAFSLHMLMQQYHRTHDEHPVVAFLDIKSAYDSVDRSVIWGTLANHLQPALLDLLKNMFDEVLVTVIIQNYESRTIRPRRGVLQGSILSPILYAVFIDDLPRRIRNGIQHAPTLTNTLAVSTISTNGVSEAALQDHDRISLRHPARRTYIRATIHLLLYADDVALVGSSEEIRLLLAMTESHSDHFGYRWSPPKCAILNGRPGVCYKLYNQPLPFVDHFKYLGVPFASKGIDAERMLQASATKGVGAMLLLHSLGAHKFAFGLGVALQLYRTFIRPIFEYGLAITHTTATHLKILERAQDRCIRLTNGVTDPDARTPTITAKALADIPSMKLRARILEFKFVVRAHELPPSTLLASVVDTLLRVHHSFNSWENLKNNTLWRDYSFLTRQAPLPRHPVSHIINSYRDQEYARIKTVKKSVARLREKRIWDPILYLPASTRDRHRLVNWRLHYLPSFPLSDCRCGHKEAHRDHFMSCDITGPLISQRLKAAYGKPIPDDIHILDFIMNDLPLRARALKRGHWRETWPLLLYALRDIDVASHPDDTTAPATVAEPEPPPQQALDEFLAAQQQQQ
ncbi:hypothetical protein RO3G_05925 [Lichtheimia corymbifera JMRC:FSU:9682]|uniref:Reverse transcriptase domain-containing protein n=1 Tax=Lichtheimia corymbifera JMRC:FSU:9682 TaxID=1263082 RepID=A0A068SID1_9FUNG|nr:hypothetical protein RO3G_05925 [Lichtheimia corymbifera JMRC:FSU:9682]